VRAVEFEGTSSVWARQKQYRMRARPRPRHPIAAFPQHRETRETIAVNLSVVESADLTRGPGGTYN
jgi:hypothetical protein